jgi:hypothetical protein
MGIATLVAGILVIYVLPGWLFTRCLFGSTSGIRFASPFFSIVLVGTLYSVTGLLWPLAIAPQTTCFMAGSIILPFLLLHAIRKGRPLLRILPPSVHPSPAIRSVGIGIATAAVLLVATSHASNLLGRLPNITDSLGRVNMLVTLDLTGIPPRHWLQPTLNLVYYFFSYVPAAALAQFGRGEISMPVIWWIHTVLQAIGYSALAYHLFFQMMRNAGVGVCCLAAILFGSSFGFVPGLLDGQPGVDYWLFNALRYQGTLVFASPASNAMWVPQHFVALVASLAIPYFYWQCQGFIAVKIALCALLLVFIAGASTFLFIPLCLGIGAWFVWSMIRREWHELGFWSGTLLLAALGIWPFYRYISLQGGGSGLRLADHTFRFFSSFPLANQIAGFGLELTYLFVQFGFASLAAILLARHFMHHKAVPQIHHFALISSSFAMLCLMVVTSSIGRDDLNNLALRGLLIPYSLLLFGLVSLPVENLIPRGTWQRAALLMLILYSFAPALYGYAGSMNFLRKMAPVANVTRWANNNLPRDAVVVVDAAVLGDHTIPYLDTYGRAPWAWIERLKWIPASQMVDPERSTLSPAQAPEQFPEQELGRRARYLFRYRNSPLPQDATNVYQDEKYAVDKLQTTRP